MTEYGKTLTEIDIPSEIGGVPVLSVGDGAFSNCDSLASVTIPDSVTKIGVGAFSSCVGLEKIYIPKNAVISHNSDEDISPASALLGGCSSLTDVYYGGTQEKWNGIAEGFDTGVTAHFGSSELDFRIEFEGYVIPDEPQSREASDGPGKASDTSRTDEGADKSADDGDAERGANGVAISVVVVCAAVAATCVAVVLTIRKKRSGGTK